MANFGDYDYGTEILEMPRLDEGFASKDSPHIDPPIFCPRPREPDSEEISEQHQYWFRWITGHQTMFMLWRMLTMELRALSSDASIDRFAQSTTLLRGCSVLFDYTGSMHPDFYTQHLRNFMSMFHKSFSGMWASDYQEIPKLAKRAMTLECSGPVKESQNEFKETYLLTQREHVSIAKKLVPEGGSLLKNARRDGYEFAGADSHHYLYYDFFFLVNRKPVTFDYFLQSLERRITAIVDDLHAHPTVESLIQIDNPAQALHEARECMNGEAWLAG